MVNRSNTTEACYLMIREMLLKHDFEEGERIEQNNLALSLGVSRTPVIKALHMLVSEGLIDYRENRGFFVHVTTLRELTELFVIRQALETVAATSLAITGTEEQFDQLESFFRPFINCNNIEYDAYYKADREFHMLMIEMCDNSLLKKMNSSLQLMARSLSFGLLRPPEITLDEHLKIIRALQNRDVELTQQVTHAHTENTKTKLLQLNRQMLSLGIDSNRLSVKDIFTRSFDARNQHVNTQNHR